MRCPDCGAENFDGAHECMVCGSVLVRSDAAPALDPEKTGKSGWIVMAVAGIGMLILAGLFVGQPGTPGGGGGGSSPSTGTVSLGSPDSPSSAPVPSGVTTRAPTDDERKRSLSIAAAAVAKAIPGLEKLTPRVIAYSLSGSSKLAAVYETTMTADGQTGANVRVVVVSIDLKTGEGRVSQSY